MLNISDGIRREALGRDLFGLRELSGVDISDCGVSKPKSLWVEWAGVCRQLLRLRCGPLYVYSMFFVGIGNR